MPTELTKKMRNRIIVAFSLLLVTIGVLGFSLFRVNQSNREKDQTIVEGFMNGYYQELEKASVYLDRIASDEGARQTCINIAVQALYVSVAYYEAATQVQEKLNAPSGIWTESYSTSTGIWFVRDAASVLTSLDIQISQDESTEEALRELAYAIEDLREIYRAMTAQYESNGNQYYIFSDVLKSIDLKNSRLEENMYYRQAKQHY